MLFNLYILSLVKIPAMYICAQSISAGIAAPPYNLIQSSNSLTNAIITWNSTETDVTYTVTSTSQMSPFSGILEKSYVLSDLEVETDYIVSVTATNECGDESQPSESIIVRIDAQGIIISCFEKTGHT